MSALAMPKNFDLILCHFGLWTFLEVILVRLPGQRTKLGLNDEINFGWLLQKKMAEIRVIL